MNFKDAIKLINNDSLKSECLITRQPINNEMKLKCNHIFEYDAILENLKKTQSTTSFHVCPYCRRKFDNFIPFYQTHKNHVFDKQIFKKNNYLKCSHVFKSGKNKGTTCNKSANKFEIGIFCNSHYNKIISKPKTICYCKQILKNGNNCKFKIFDFDSNLCKRHYNISKKI